MQRYLVRVFALAALVIAAHCAIILSLPAPIYAEYWVRELIVVKQKLASEIAAPKTIFLGGSSTMFSIDAKQVEQQTGRPAINMGLHASMGLDDLLSVGASVVRSGDILVLLLEPPYYDCDRRGWSEWRVRNALAWDRVNFDRMPLYRRAAAVVSAGGPVLSAAVIKGNLAVLFSGGIPAARKAALGTPDSIWQRYRSGAERPSDYRYSAFNLDDHGSMLHTEKAQFHGAGTPVSMPAGICPATIAQLGAFVTVMRSKQVTVLFGHTPYLIEGGVKANWATSEAEFAKDVTAVGSTLIDRRDDLFFPRQDFFDTPLHLNSHGRGERTQRIIAALKPGMGAIATGMGALSGGKP